MERKVKRLVACMLTITLTVISINYASLEETKAGTLLADEIPHYTVFQAETYAMEQYGFDAIFVGTDSSSFARNLYKDLKNDTLFINSVRVWEMNHIATSPSYSLESGLITKKDFYKAILFDMLDTSTDGELMSAFGNTYSKLYKMIKNKNTSYIVSTANKIMGKDSLTADELNTFKYIDLSDESKKLLLNGSKYAKYSSVVKDVDTLLGYANSAYDAISSVADYLSIKEAEDGTKEILDAIASDNSNDAELRMAAGEIATCFESAYDSALIAIAEGTTSGLETVLGGVMDNAWNEVIATIPGGAAVLMGAKGARVLCNQLFSTDKLVEGYYQLESAVNIEDALIRALKKKKTLVENDSLENATIYMQGIAMYKDIILLGFDYSIELLENACNSTFNTSTDFWVGNYSECMSLINQIETFKKNKINNFVQYESIVLNSYINKYCPNYNEIEESLNNAHVDISSMSVKQKKNINVGDTGSIYDYFSFTYLPENHTEISSEDGVTSSDESVIKVVKNNWTCDDITAVGEGTCTLTFTSNLGKVTDSIEITIGKYKDESESVDDWDIGLMYDSDKNIIAYIREYKGTAANVVIPNSYKGYDVIRIDDSVFKNNTNVKSIIIPDNIKYISNSIFSGCTQLQNVTLSSNLTSIPSGAFMDCTSLYSIRIPNSVKSIGSYSFSGCTNLESIVLPSSITYIGEGAFKNCMNLSNKITLPIEITNIRDETFYGCKKIKGVNISNKITEIGKNAFFDCECLQNLTIPDSVVNIDYNAFASCNLKNVVIGDSLTDLCGFDFNSSLQSIIIGNSIKYLNDSVFSGCNNLKRITIPNSVTSIGENAFLGCSSLSDLTIPDTVTFIGEYALSGCKSLKYLKIPCSVELTEKNNIAYTGLDNIETMVFSVGTGKMVDYNAASSPVSDSRDSLKEVIFEEGIEYIGSYALYNCKNITGIVIPKSVKEIGNYAFSGCDALSKVEFSGTLSQWCNINFNQISGNPNEKAHCLYIGGEKIEGTLTIPSDISVINKSTFAGCYDITSVVIPDSVTEIRLGAFDNCINIEHISIPNGIKVISQWAFSECENLLDIYITIMDIK